MTRKDILMAGLKKTHGMPLDQAVNVMDNLFEAAELLMSVGPPSTGIWAGGAANQAPQPVMGLQPPSGLIVPASVGEDPYARMAEPAACEPFAAPPRIRTIEPTVPADYEYRTVNVIREYLDQSAPPFFDVILSDTHLPSRVVRKITPMDTLGYVRLSYGIPDDPDPQFEVFKTTEPTLGLAEKIERIKAGIQAKYTANKREIQPRMAKPQQFKIGTGEGGFGGDVDDTSAGAKLAAEWSANRSPEMAQFMRNAPK